MTASNAGGPPKAAGDLAVREWGGFVVVSWVLLQIAAVLYCRGQIYDYYGKADLEEYYRYSWVVGAGTAVLALAFMVGVFGLIPGARWPWRVFTIGAGLQILFTVGTQIWQLMIPALRGKESLLGDGSSGVIGAIMGILLWNVLPAGILILALGAQRPGRHEALARSGVVGLLLGTWLTIQFMVVIFCHLQDVGLRQRLDPYCWHIAAVGIGTAALAMVFMVGRAGLILGARWTWRVLTIGAGLQILFTVVTQVWQASLPSGRYNPDLMGSIENILLFRPHTIATVAGILLWNIIPVGILVLSLLGWRSSRREAAAKGGSCAGCTTT